MRSPLRAGRGSGYGRHVLTALLVAAALAVPVTVQQGPCPGADPMFTDGCYLADTNEVWVQPGELSGGEWTFWHEMGHAYIAQRLDAGERMAASCLPAMISPWEEDPARCGTWDEDVEEAFADAYRNCAMRVSNPASPDFVDGHDYAPTTKRRHVNACRFINRAAD